MPLAPRQSPVASKILPSIETGGSRTSSLSNGSENAEAKHLQRYRSWTPEPRRKDEFMIWALKYFGARWCELKGSLPQERDHLKYYDMLQAMRQIELEKRLEHEKEKKAALGDEYIPDPFLPSIESVNEPPYSLSDGSEDYDSSNSHYDSGKEPDDPGERLEWRRIHLHYDDKRYEEAKAKVEACMKAQREEQERDRIETAEWYAIVRLKESDPVEYERRMRVHNLQYDKGLTQEQAEEQIEAADREEAAARERRQRKPVTRSFRVFGMKRTQEEIDKIKRAWDAQGVDHEEQVKLARMFDFQDPEPAITDGRADSPSSKTAGALQPQASPPRLQKTTKGISHGARNGRITKKVTQSQTVVRRNTRSRRSAPTLPEAPILDDQPKRAKGAYDMLDGSVGSNYYTSTT